MKVIKSAFQAGMPHVPCQIRKHGVHIGILLNPSIQRCKGKMMAEIISSCWNTKPCGLPNLSEILADGRAFVATVCLCWEEIGSIWVDGVYHGVVSQIQR